jgi:glutaredoxin 3
MELYTVSELKGLAKSNNLKGYSSLRKSELIKLLNTKQGTKQCPSHQILNPKSNKCVNRSGKIGKLLLDIPVPKQGTKTCPSHQILNPKSNKCVNRSGKIGKLLLDIPVPKQGSKQSTKQGTKTCPSHQILNPKSNKCVIKSGRIGKLLLKEGEDISQGENTWFIYTKEGCPYCVKAKKLLKKHKQKFNEYVVTEQTKESVFSKLDKKTGNYRYYPTIFLNNEFFGGFDNLKSYFPQKSTEIKITSTISEPKVKGMVIPSSKNTVKTTTYNGSIIGEISSMLFLAEKFSNDCVVIPTIKKTDKELDWTDALLQYTINKNNQRILFPEGYWKSLIKCKHNKRFIVIPFFIYHTTTNKLHANMLIYDTKYKSLERFDPNGPNTASHASDHASIDNAVIAIFKKKLGEKFISSYHTPLDFCPLKNFQHIQHYEKVRARGDPVGFCSVWSFWYANLRLSNPEMDRKVVIKKALKELSTMNINFTTFIRNYSDAMAKFSKDLKSSKSPIKTFEKYAKAFN